MANAARADEQRAQQVEAVEKDSPLLDQPDAAVKKFIETAKAHGYVTYDQLNAVLSSEEVPPSRSKTLCRCCPTWELLSS